MTYAVLIYDREGHRTGSRYELTREQALAQLEPGPNERRILHEYDWSGFPKPRFDAQSDFRARGGEPNAEVHAEAIRGATVKETASNEKISSLHNRDKTNGKKKTKRTGQAGLF